MVYLPSRAVNSKCDTSFDTVANLPTITQCQEAGDKPYCWPANGTRICASSVRDLPFYWPPTFYNAHAFFYVDFGSQHTQGPNTEGGIDVTRLQKELVGWESQAERMPGTDETILRITIREWYPYLDSVREAVHEGPTLVIVPTPTQATSTTTSPPSRATSALLGETTTATPESRPPLTSEQIVGISFGAVVVFIAVVALLYSFCKQHCLACCFPGEAETNRVKAAERRRIRDDRARAQPDVDAIKAAVARGEVWHGPGRVRAGGAWAMDWPASPSRVARPAQRASGVDEIGAVGSQEAVWMEEQRRELERIEEARRQEQRREEQMEEQRVAERREEVARVGEAEPPAYEAPPPKYTP